MNEAPKKSVKKEPANVDDSPAKTPDDENGTEDYNSNSSNNGDKSPTTEEQESQKYEKNQLSLVRQSTPPKDKTPEKDGEDIIYDGGIPSEDDEEEDMGYKMIFDSLVDPLDAPNPENVEIEVRGIRYKVPFNIHCHLCREIMTLCIRRTRYRGQQRDYPAYRCTRKGCQTFRSIRKVFGSCLQVPLEGKTAENQKVIYQLMPPPPPSPKMIKKTSKNSKEEKEIIVQRVNLPRHHRRAAHHPKPPSISERMRRANQERSLTFSEFSAQLRRDIAANKRVRTRKNLHDVSREDGGTLLYITKELTPNEIIELQDVVIQSLMNMRKIPMPMTLDDLPLFSHCPWPKRLVESGMETELGFASFCDAFSRAPQPPLPVGFVRRPDETLIYRNPKPFKVPEHLMENSPAKMHEDIMNYQIRKEELEARRYEMRFAQKKGFMAYNTFKRSNQSPDDVDCGGKRPRRPTMQELLTLMENQNDDVISGKIRPVNKAEKRMQWIDNEVSDVLGEPKEEEQKGTTALTNNPENIHLNRQPTPKSPSSPILFAGYQFNQNLPQNAYFLAPPLSAYNQMQMDPDQPLNATYLPQGFGQNSEFTYVNPQSGAQLTDPSAFLTSFIPSPVTKVAPMGFGVEQKLSTAEEKK